MSMRPLTHVYIKNDSGYYPEPVKVRITHVNPDKSTVTIQDAMGHVWFGVPLSKLRKIAAE